MRIGRHALFVIADKILKAIQEALIKSHLESPKAFLDKSSFKVVQKSGYDIKVIAQVLRCSTILA
jgi:hypothetical protein